MDRWNPKSFLIEGRANGFNADYLEELVKAGRMIDGKNIPVIYSLAHLASLSSTLYSDLHSYVDEPPDDCKSQNYKNFTISKRSGGVRWISVPCPPLYAAQSFIAQEILNRVVPHSAAMAYVPGLPNPLKANAEKHLDSRWLLKMDIKDFFSNISERQVYHLFKSLGYSKLLSFEMSRLCTRITPKRLGKRWNVKSKKMNNRPYDVRHIGSLPQGAPSSPALSNLICIDMDRELEELARNSNADYSRYADDLCFSFLNASRDSVFQLKKEAGKVLHKHSFSENRKKSRIIPPGARKIITGVVIDSGKASIPKELRSRIRMHLFYCKRFGIPEHCSKKGFRSVLGFRNHLYGLIMYVRTINQDQGEKFLDEFSQLPWLNFNI